MIIIKFLLSNIKYKKKKTNRLIQNNIINCTETRKINNNNEGFDFGKRYNSIIPNERKLLNELGSLLLLSAVGDISMLTQTDPIDIVPEPHPRRFVIRNGYFPEKETNNNNKGECCFLHMLINIASKDTSKIHQNSFRKKSPSGNPFNKDACLAISCLFQSRFSPDFTNFLCVCLGNQVKQEEVGLRGLQDHPWLNNKQNFKGPVVDLNNLVPLAMNMIKPYSSFKPFMHDERIELMFRKIDSLITSYDESRRNSILTTYSKDKQSEELIKDLASGFGCRQEVIKQKFEETINYLK